MPRHRFKSINEKGGLQAHLDATKPIHRGFGYKTYKILRYAGLNTTNRARAFDVGFETIKDWDTLDDGRQIKRKKKKAKKVVKADKSVEELHD